MKPADLDHSAHSVARLMATGGDARITLDPATGANRYFSTPYPRDLIAYASSTANDISADAFHHVAERFGASGAAIDAAGYAVALEALRARIRAAYRIADDDVRIIFSPSGTDLEYVALAAMFGGGRAGIHNILLGADEVGSGCIHSARGEYFAGETALGIATRAGQPVPGLGEKIDMIDIPVRDREGRAVSSGAIRAAMQVAIAAARARGYFPLLHIVHGSKTGLVLPHLGDIDAMSAEHGENIGLVVDACQARITSSAIADYLARGAVVFLTGSKFMGGPPFSGFALVPAALADKAPAIPEGLAAIFRRAEWAAAWPGADRLSDTPNPGLLLRLEAAIFELERFQKLDLADIGRVVLAFHAAVRATMVEKLGGRRIAPYALGGREEADEHPIEMRTLSTIDISGLPGAPDFDASRRLHQALVSHGVRLGQPVKCVALPGGGWGGTLRLGLSMPQIVAFAALEAAALEARLAADMSRIEQAFQQVTSAAT